MASTSAATRSSSRPSAVTAAAGARARRSHSRTHSSSTQSLSVITRLFSRVPVQTALRCAARLRLLCPRPLTRSPPHTSTTHQAQQGLIDGSHLGTALKKATSDQLISSRLLKSSLLQLVTLLSAVLIKPLITKATGGQTADPRSSAHATYSIAWWLFHLIWLWPLAAVATYYSGLLRPTQETDRRRGQQHASDPKGLVAGLVQEVSTQPGEFDDDAVADVVGWAGRVTGR